MVPPQQQRAIARAPSQPHRGIGTIPKLAAALIVIVVLYFIVTMFISPGAASVNGPTNFNVTNSTTLFSLNGQEYSMKFVSASSPTVVVAITRLPVFINPTMMVTLYIHNNTNVNGVGTYANMQIRLLNISTKHAEISITPVPVDYGIVPDAARIRLVQTILPAPGQSINETTATTTSTSTSSTTTGSSSSSTTVTPGGANNATAQSILKQSAYYPAMANYSIIYNNTVNCTATMYDNTMFQRYGKQPSGIDSYQNVSSLVPYSMKLSITNSTATMYKAVWSTTSHSSVTTGTALTINMDIATKTITSSVTSGVFYELNASELNTAVVKASGIGNACGIYVTSTQCYQLGGSSATC